MGVTSMVKCMMYQSILSIQEGDDDWPSNDLSELIHWLVEKWGRIPLTYRDTAKCEISAVEGSFNNPPDATISISYRRPETPEETESRIQHTFALTERSRQKEITELERLLEKYPEYRRN